MNSTFKNTSLAILLVAGLPASLSGQGLKYGAKFGAGVVLSSAEPQGSRATVNAAFLMDWQLGKNRELFGEFNVRAYNSVDHEVTQFGTGYTSTGATGTITPNTSVDVRKDTLKGWSLNAGYRQQFGSSIYWWQGGIALAQMTSQQEVTGTINVSGDIEGLNYTPAKKSFRPGLFAGVQAKLSPNFFIEANVFAQSYEWANYVPRSYTGQTAHVDYYMDTKVSLDINVGFRF